MKKLSTEEKAKRYDEALEKARQLCAYPTTEPFISDLQDLFPELKEPDDEKIRKAIIEHFAGSHSSMFPYKGFTKEQILAWLEKQGEQKPIDKVEPKFNLYDWVVTDKGDVVQIGAVNNGYYTLLNGMDFNMSYVDKCWHLWTIQDAKDGDILCTYECGEPKIVFILKGTPKPKKPCVLRFHCYYNLMYPYFESDFEKGCLAPNKEDVKPATKEQRKLLFAKMYEAGYEWNFDKKKLKKL